MSNRQKILLSVVILVLANLLLIIVFGDNGLVDFHLLRQEKERLLERNEALSQENIALYREIDRLNNDLKYIENVARQELGMIGKNEIIFRFTPPEEDKKSTQPPSPQP